MWTSTALWLEEERTENVFRNLTETFSKLTKQWKPTLWYKTREARHHHSQLCSAGLLTLAHHLMHQVRKKIASKLPVTHRLLLEPRELTGSKNYQTWSREAIFAALLTPHTYHTVIKIDLSWSTLWSNNYRTFHSIAME